MVRLLIGLAACAAMAMADITFNLVGLREKENDEFGVLVNGKLTKLTTTKEKYPLWTAHAVGVEAPLDYTFVQIDKAGKIQKKEKGVRKLPEGATLTPNDFFDRPHTLHTLPPLPQVYENKLQQNSPFFREGYIGNIFIEGDPGKFATLHKGGESEDYHPSNIKVNIHYVGANDNVRINNVEMNLSGASTRKYAKVPYQFKFPENKRLLNLETLKLRNEESDATMMREKIYVDVLNSLGVPAQQATYVRLFFNGKPVGLYVAVEEMKQHWVDTVLRPEAKQGKKGSLWKMNSSSDSSGNLQWLGPTTKNYNVGRTYKNILQGQNPKNNLMQDLIGFMADLKEYNPKKTKNPVAYWEKRMDLNSFLRSMVMEFLAGDWDSYWQRGSNYQIYNDPVTNKWIWLPTDFDDTFGRWFDGKIESYKAIPKVNKHGFESPLVQRLIVETPAINKMFEAVLKETVNYVFKPSALAPRLEAYKNMIAADVAWDRSLKRLNNGRNLNFNIQDLTKGLGKGVQHDWGLMDWVQKRSLQVQKELGFKALPGNPTKLGYHAMTVLGSPYGVVAKKEVVAPQPAAAPPVEAPVDLTTSYGNPPAFIPYEEDVTMKANSAEVLDSNWAALSAVLAMIVIIL